MGIVNRVNKIVRSNFGHYSGSHKELDGCDNGKARKYLGELRSSLINIKSMIQKLDARLRSSKDDFIDLEKKAIKALDAGDDSKARLILKERQRIKKSIDKLDNEKLELLKESSNLSDADIRLTNRLNQLDINDNIDNEIDNTNIKMSDPSNALQKQGFDPEIEKWLSELRKRFS